MRELLFVMFLTLNSTLILSQSYNFINYGIGDGLTHEKVTDVCEDQFGNLWIATAGGGLSKFNGLEFENFTIKDGLSSNYIRDILSDRKGNIWAATATGISKLDGRSITNFNIDSINQNNNSVNVIYESSNGSIWFSASASSIGQIDTLNNLSLITIPELSISDRIIDIDQDLQGNIWLISAINGLLKYDGDEFTEVVKNSSYKGYVLSIQKTLDNQFYLGTNRGLIILNPETEEYRLIDELPGAFVKSIVPVEEGVFWIVSSTGAAKYNKGKLNVFGSAQGLTDNRINVIYSDREGNVWIGSDGSGLYKLTNETIQFLGIEHGLKNTPVTAIVKDNQGHYWFGSLGKGLSKWDGENFEYFNSDNGLVNNYVTALNISPKGEILIGTRGSGLLSYDGKKFKQFNTSDGLIYNIVRQIFIDSNDGIWIGTLNGLSHLDGENFTSFNEENGLSDNVIWGIREHQNNQVLIVTRSGFDLIKDGSIMNMDINSSFFNKRINTAVIDEKENIWIGYSGHGIVKITNDQVPKYYTSTSGLSSDLIYSLHLDSVDNVIVGTERGIDKLILTNQELNIKSYDQIEGFSNLQTTYGSVYMESDERIWFGSDEGVFIYNISKEKINQNEPLAYISSIKLFYDELDWSTYSSNVSSWMNIPYNLELPYRDNNLIVSFQGTSLRNPALVRYKYRLIGQDEKWSPMTNRNEAVYTNLSPGEYTFELLAGNSDNIWTNTPVSYSFKIIPPFYLEWWFYVISFVSVLILLKLINDQRLKVKLDKILTLEKIRSEEQQKVRKKMARDFHDNLGNQLASISVYTNLVALKLKNKSKEINDLLGSIQKHSNSLFSGTKDFIWSMDPESDDLSEIFTYIKDFGEELYENTKIEFFASAEDIEDKSIPLPSGWSRQLVLIFKEAMTNVLKHSEATEVYFRLYLIKNDFIMTLTDNGIGIEETVKEGVGMRSMKTRAEQIGAIFEIKKEKKHMGMQAVLKARLPS